LAYTYNLSTRHFKDYKLGYHITAREIIDKVRHFDLDMKKAIDLKDSFYEMMHTTSYKKAETVLESFIDDLYQTKLPEFKIVARTYTNWKEEIINSFITYDKKQLTNGFIEGLNNKIKVIKRIAFGYRNFDHFRLRIFALTHNDCPMTSL
jgi:transposase